MTGLGFLKLAALSLAIITSVCYLYQLVYPLVPFFKKAPSHKSEKMHRYAVLIAARNEEAVIGHLLDSIRAQDYPAHLITTYVIADNCTDGTAKVAQAHGARVFTRVNRQKVGKGYALDYLLKQIEHTDGLEQYDAFLIFDADNLLQPDYIRAINRTCSDGYEAFCGYRNAKNFGSNWLTSGYSLMYLHESVHLNRARMLLGTCCGVNGTGFGFTRALLERCGGWNFFTLTEDLEFTAWCATQGVQIGYCHDAILFDEHPTRFSQSWRQRTRWAQGGVQVSLRYLWDYPRGMAKGGRQGWASFEFATLSIWGILLAVSGGTLSLLSVILEQGWSAGMESLLWSVLSAYGSLFLLGCLTLATEHRRIRATRKEQLLSLLTFPVFMMSFIPIAVGAVFQKPQWKPIAHTVAVSAQTLLK